MSLTPIDNEVFHARILVVDDNESIHEDYSKSLNHSNTSVNKRLDELGSELFEDEPSTSQYSMAVQYEIHHAFQGEEAVEMVKTSMEKNEPYVLIFLDVRMPPGMDGITALGEIWKVCPDVEVVLCSAYSDYSWDDVLSTVGVREKLMYFSKPFSPMTIQQMALSLTNKWVLSQKAKDLNEELERKVDIRTSQLRESRDELKSSLENLREMHNLLVESEKMAALGGLVAGVAHEINTPLGIGITGVSFLKEKVQSIEKHLVEKTLRQSTLEEMLASADESLSLISNNLKRAADLVKSFKQVAADQISEQCSSFSFMQCLKETLFSLGPKLRNIEVKINSEIHETFKLYSYPGIISQIVVNLVMNSVIHGYDNGSEGLIEIDVKVKKNLLFFLFKDYGIGMDAETKQKVFDPFFTTKRAQGGTGLGCHITYNLVYQKLKGSISCESEVGKGTCFEILLPIKPRADHS
ncbi:MAG: hybrid sensor histidine kinase/response regulator [Planctomycetes bacterium]|nr:hybrid sensor histidine kinase/response regulator [Planctomycetota bacterium]